MNKLDLIRFFSIYFSSYFSILMICHIIFTICGNGAFFHRINWDIIEVPENLYFRLSFGRKKRPLIVRISIFVIIFPVFLMVKWGKNHQDREFEISLCSWCGFFSRFFDYVNSNAFGRYLCNSFTLIFSSNKKFLLWS